MITTANLPTARRLLASFNDAMQYKRAHNPKPMRDWLREAKPLAGLELASRPAPFIVFHMIKGDTEKAEAAMSGARSMMASAPDTLPAPPAEIVITLPPVPAAHADATIAADRKAARSPIKDTVARLWQHEEKIRAKARRLSSLVGVTPEVADLLDLAAHLHEAAEILDDAGGYDA